MRKNTVIALCVVIVLLALGMQRMGADLVQAVPKLSEQTLTTTLADLKTHFAARDATIRTPGKTVVVILTEPAALPAEPDLAWLKAYFLQWADFQSFQKYELRYEKAGTKGQFLGDLRP
ncbi:hypothetical protein [Deinococcus roseus]|uniref:Uncharacterized protein n=1 Tax=Deinococcus roseus TaxID=392414 RepID=A0ABQ2D487_9DEIO|nr:hypothetical protein [Deinococcus roseus]GGJ44857.1 hypothetical protein GCM10008938_33870 [Deinococcus roseus]